LGSSATAVVISNCQAFGVANAVQALTGIRTTSLTIADLEKAPEEDLERYADADILLVARKASRRISGHRIEAKASWIPMISFNGYHPDVVYLQRGGTRAKGVLGEYHSALAFAAFRCDRSVRSTVELFNAETYRQAGYLDAWDPARESLFRQFKASGLALEDRFYAWSRSTPFMHTVNHPAIRVLTDVAAAALREIGQPIERATEFPDNLANGAVFPVYPEIGEALGVPGSYRFKLPTSSQTLSLEEFVKASFAAFAAEGPLLAPVPRSAALVARLESIIGEVGGG
jgi:hypothetical protein